MVSFYVELEKKHEKNTARILEIFILQENLDLPSEKINLFEGAWQDWFFCYVLFPGFAIITWNNPKKLEKPCITKGLATCQSLGVDFSHVDPDSVREKKGGTFCGMGS